MNGVRAEIIAVGSEMLTETRVDTNSLWLTGELNKLGVELSQKCVVGDDRELLAAAVAGAIERAPVVLITGGLGPTEDDVTREAVAQAMHRRLLFSEEICKGIEAIFERRGRKMAEINRRQAFLVDGAEPLHNPNGTAPGQWIDFPGGMVLLLPGPPRELKPMFENLCLPRLLERLPKAAIRTRFFRIAGMGESDVDALVAPIYKEYANPVTTILAAAGDIQLHLRAQCPTEQEAEALVEELGARIKERLGDRIYSENGEPLEAVVGLKLKDRHATLAVAESCTAGLLGGRLTEVAGASEWFLGGFQVYGQGMKARLLGLDEKMVEEAGVVSEAAAKAMADSARYRTGSTYAISITGEAGPESSSGVDPGTVWIGLAGPEGCEAKVFRFPSGRTRVRAFAVQTALNMLRLELK